jgi:hypothetical protein
MIESNGKKFFKSYLIFLGILTALALVTFFFVFFSRSSWERGLKTQIQMVLDSAYPDAYLAGRCLMPGSSTVAVALLVEVQPKQGMPFEKAHYALIVRMATIYGVIPAVFLYEAGGEVVFAGLSSFPDRFHGEILPMLNPQIRRLEKLILRQFMGEPNKGERRAI